MRKLLSCLLAAILLFTLAITATAATDGDDPAENPSVEEKFKTTEPDAEATEPEASKNVDILNEVNLPEGYEIDPNFSLTITLDADNDWTYSLKDLLGEAAEEDEYIYFFVEANVDENYTPYYSTNNSIFTKNSPGVSAGNIVVVKNVNEGEPPAYELPQTGGIGTTPYTVAGIAVLMTAAVYGVILYRRRKNIE